WTQYVALVAKAAQNVGQSVAVMAKVKLLQKALRLAADGVWGPVTEAMCVGTVTISGGGKARFNRYTLPNRKAMQRAWGCRIIDGRWGPQTQAANRAAIIAMQKALGVKADGDWGPLTDRAYRALRVKAYRP
ncbi:MAG: peptidoglycan-binding protein, partial [Streptomycetaceae bacterium]|nr:peptidoglycan-binding protein [Streptomycetaceae bacterium]